ncbi:MAG: FapA family protein [Candidatus Gastranaerophilales bacterium]|nr:FapA family protein [Candidatus Gastranaerophilales bacterium]
MQNAYFRLVNEQDGFGVRIFPAKDGGEPLKIMELIDYLDRQKIDCNIEKIKSAVDEGKETVVHLGSGPCPVCRESYVLEISSDIMVATARFFPASETGERMSVDEFANDMKYKGIVYGVQTEVLEDFFGSEGSYCTNIEVAKGLAPRHGEDARIEYYFNTDINAQPTMNEDGSVDYFHLNVVNHCKKGEVLARLIPEDAGTPGINLMGARIKPRDVRKKSLKHGNNIELSEDRMTLTSMVNGHVSLVDDNVFVSDVYEVENVGSATGNIDFDGSVQVNGNVSSNYVVKAKGNVIVNGVVEGAQIEAGGDIIIARGMNGMGKGSLKAGCNIVTKFLENATAEADGYVNTSSILHSNVSAGTQIVVTGKRGFITGGRVQADEKIDVKTLGAVMGASTIVEVGVNPKLKARHQCLQKEIGEIVQEIKNIQPVLANFAQKKAKGARFTPDQLNYVKESAQKLAVKKAELESKSEEMKELQKLFDPGKKAAVLVRGEVYPGTTIIIGDVSTVVHSNIKYCRFEKVDGDVKVCPL